MAGQLKILPVCFVWSPFFLGDCKLDTFYFFVIALYVYSDDSDVDIIDNIHLAVINIEMFEYQI